MHDRDSDGAAVRSNGKHVVVVDDEPLVGRAVQRLLHGNGYSVVWESDSTKGLDLILSEKPDLVVLDVLMPGIDGLELCRRLRRHPEGLTIPVVMLTAKSTEIQVLT